MLILIHYTRCSTKEVGSKVVVIIKGLEATVYWKYDGRIRMVTNMAKV